MTSHLVTLAFCIVAAHLAHLPADPYVLIGLAVIATALLAKDTVEATE